MNRSSHLIVDQVGTWTMLLWFYNYALSIFWAGWYAPKPRWLLMEHYTLRQRANPDTWSHHPTSTAPNERSLLWLLPTFSNIGDYIVGWNVARLLWIFLSLMYRYIWTNPLLRGNIFISILLNQNYLLKRINFMLYDINDIIIQSIALRGNYSST